MRIQIFSDLHADVLPIKPIVVAEDVEAVIVAGDTTEGALRAFKTLREIVPLTVPVVMVMGNHEYYRRFLPVELKQAQTLAAEFNVNLLENAEVVLGGVRVVGATLWTNYRIFGEASQAHVMQVCSAGMNDHKRIGWQKEPWRRFRPQEASLLHHQSRNYIEAALAAPFAGPTVVVTHHAPHWNSVDPIHRDDRVTAAYVSDLSKMIETYQPHTWIHGHIHKSSDYQVGNTRIIANPHGYGSENPRFDGALVIEVGA